jgi:hypothetical protein
MVTNAKKPTNFNSNKQKRREKMKTKASVLMGIMLVWMLLALPAPAQATTSEPLEINAELWMTGENSAAGSFEISGLINDSGNASEVFFIAANTIHGVKTLESAAGTITIRFQAKLTWTGPTTGYADGQFIVISSTGAYEKLHGVGTTHAELDLSTYHILATYTGTGHFD